MGKELMDKFEAPVILKEGEFKLKDLESLKKTRKIWESLDIYKSQLLELFEINNPSRLKDKNLLGKFLDYNLSSNPLLKGSWVYFPWNGALIHMLSENDYYTLRTNRNRDIIKKPEQNKLKDFTVGIAGLSVGSNIALTLAHLGAGQELRIADNDELQTSNLNRVPSGVLDLGLNKAYITAQKLYEIDPFLRLKIYPQGLTKKSLSDFFLKGGRLNLIVDSIDDFEMKVRLRIFAKEKRIPVLMMTNLGDSCLVDVERYDLNQKTKIFNGLLGNLHTEILKTDMSEENKTKLAAKIVGIEHIPNRAIESLMKIGKTLVGRPQLGSTVSISAGIAAYIIRKIATKEKWRSERLLLHFDSGFLDTHNASKIYDNEPNRKNLIKNLRA